VPITATSICMASSNVVIPVLVTGIHRAASFGANG